MEYLTVYIDIWPPVNYNIVDEVGKELGIIVVPFGNTSFKDREAGYIKWQSTFDEKWVTMFGIATDKALKLYNERIANASTTTD